MMKLEIADFPVKNVQFGNQTSYDNGVLSLNKEELLALILEDKKIASADLDIAFPGEQTRIAFVRDPIEPRLKVSGSGCVFPGILGPVETVGEGRTHKLSGVTVITSAQYRSPVSSGHAGQNSGLVDMWGPGAKLSPYAALLNIVPVLKLIDTISELDAHTAIQQAGFKVAKRIAETTRDKNTRRVEVFELSEVSPSLPRVVYNICYVSERAGAHSGISLYGMPLREGLPVFLHPNEIFDGAVTKDARQGGGGKAHNWEWVNQPIILQLYKEHGKKLNFLGVILQRASFEGEHGKQLTAQCASQMARLLRADSAILTSMAGVGNTYVGALMTAQAYEKKGIKTVFITLEQGGAEGSLPLPLYTQETNAMISTGDIQIEHKLPAPAKVIGCEKWQLMEPRPGEGILSPWEECTIERLYNISGAVDWFGNMNFRCEEY